MKNFIAIFIFLLTGVSTLLQDKNFEKKVSLLKKPPTSINSIGNQISKQETVLTKFPYILTRCDQSIEYEGYTLPDIGDYTIRKKMIFTINAYYFNMFNSKNPNSLVKSISLINSSTSWTNLKGARGCVKIQDSQSFVVHKTGFEENRSHVEKPAYLCSHKSENKQVMINLLDVMKYFEDCRAGKTQKMFPKYKNNLVKKLQKLIKFCPDPEKLIANIKKLKRRIVVDDIVKGELKKINK